MKNEENPKMKVWDGIDPMPGYVLLCREYQGDIRFEPWFKDEVVYDDTDPYDFPGAVFVPKARYDEYKSRHKNE